MAGVHRSRRELIGYSLGSAVLGVAAPKARSVPTSRPAGANERISVGLVGAGDRGMVLMEWINRLARQDNVTVTAICDIWNQRRESAAQKAAELFGQSVRECRTLSEMCDLKDVDALVIATPDFQHAPQAKQAVESGKDVFVEKPLGCDFRQIKLARDAVKRTRRILQLGTQRRSEGLVWAARDFVRKGQLGRITYVETSLPTFQQRWRIPGAETSLSESDTNWGEFLSYTPKVPFNARYYREFRLFWPYSSGPICQWMTHSIDQVNLVLGEQPRTAVTSGGIYLWQDGRNNPDTVHCLLEYPSGCLVSFHMRLGNGAHTRELMFYGTNGTLDLQAGVAFGEGGGGEVVLQNPGAWFPEYTTDALRRLPDRVKGGVILRGRPDRDHMSDFFSSMRSRRQPCAGVDGAFDAALATTMAAMSLRQGRRIEFDADKDELTPGEPTAATTPVATPR
ncbi:MAG TPA: Gfo/Idh/MocA family oxidoreductase [Phycisphaerae bacterium]|nr:Gfo/Idh/MocA family oxidoreductase [Phycisphaerae bacterium]HRY67305.1 Gfo/Idh/MocA family oxidoreductase [Phycisphaerae bacterium]HSA28448.1 Gfo/Idh/MocA family oxidoreductase [Phycisphaerae bacterium]